MSGVSLSSGVGSILLSLQHAAAQTNAIQNRLATGKKVASALDNPSSYFTASALGRRAGDLDALLDQIGQARQTLAAAGNGIAGLSKLVEAAKSLALQARQAPLPQSSYAAIAQTGSADVSSETIGAVTGNVDTSGAFATDVEGLQIQVGATTYTVHGSSSPGTENITAIVNDINNTAGLGASGLVRASLDATGKYLKLTATSSDVSFQVLASSAATALGVGGQSGTSTNLLQAVGGLAGTSLTVNANGGGAHTVTFGTGGGQVSTFAELQSALGNAGVTLARSGQNLTIGVDGSVTQNSLTTSGGALAALGLPGAGTEYGAVNAPVPDATRTSTQAQYNTLLQQIDRLAADASYGGVNLLAGNSLTATFNETGASVLTMTGVTFDATGLSLTAASGSDFQSNPVLDGIVTALDAALTRLRTQAATFGSNLTVLQTRQDFTRRLINTLQSGADDLVLADTNAEGAHLLALQTRQGLSLTALSLAAQSDQAVLTLFA